MLVERIPTFVNEAQAPNASSSINITEEGITMLVNDVHSLKER